MIKVTIDEDELKQMYLTELTKKIAELDEELIYWDTQQLKKRTSMSWNTIQKNFFYDPRFPKKKIGGKWYFHAEKTKEFLTTWFFEQGN